MTEPLTPPDCDLRGLLFMPLDVLRLRDSDLSLVASGDEFKAAVLLWCASWHQVPAASLPDEDRVLARLSGLDARAWRKARDGAMRGWMKCDDGRLYHPVVAEKALETWKDRLRYRQKRDQDRERLASWRERKQVGNGDETPDETRFETPKGVERTGSGEVDSVSNETDAAASSIDPDKRAWDDGRALLTSGGRMTDAKARQLIGKLIRDGGFQARDLLPAIAQAIALQTQDPASYLTKAAEGIGRRKGTAQPPAPAVIDWADRAKVWRELKRWNPSWGPLPGEPGCGCPAELLRAR